MAVTVGAPTCHRLHHLIHRPPPPSSSLSLFPKPLLLSSSSSAATPFPRHHFLLRRTTTTTTSPSRPFLPARPRIFCHSTTALKVSLQGDEQTQQLEIAEDDDSGEETETEIENLDSEESAQMGSESSPELKINAVKPPTLTVKEKKELASYAHSLGKKLKSQLVGKSGVTASLAAAFVENLESNELLKVKIHGTCPEELEDTVKKLEEGTGSVVVGQIGRTVILYRPSLTKLKAEEKRQESRKVFTRRKFYSRPTMMESQKGERPRMYEHGSPTMMESQKKGGRPRMNGRDSRGRTRV